MKKKLLMLTLALGAAAAASMVTVPQAEAACKKICCPSDNGPVCVTCCQSPCPTIVCPP